MKVGVEEVDEALFWLEFLVHIQAIPETHAAHLSGDLNQPVSSLHPSRER